MECRTAAAARTNALPTTDISSSPKLSHGAQAPRESRSTFEPGGTQRSCRSGGATALFRGRCFWRLIVRFDARLPGVQNSVCAISHGGATMRRRGGTDCGRRDRQVRSSPPAQPHLTALEARTATTGNAEKCALSASSAHPRNFNSSCVRAVCCNVCTVHTQKWASIYTLLWVGRGNSRCTLS